MKFTAPKDPAPFGLESFPSESALASLLWLGLIGVVLWKIRRHIFAPTRPMRKWVRETVHIPVPGYLSKRNAQAYRDIAPAPNAGVSRRPSDQGVTVACKWTRRPGIRENVIAHWRCASCGADGYSSDGEAPKECKQGMRSGVF